MDYNCVGHKALWIHLHTILRPQVKHNIYTFSINIVEIYAFDVKRTKINKRAAGLLP